MADFTTSDFGEAGGSPVSPKQAVVDTGPAFALQFAQDAANTIGQTVFDMAEQRQKAQSTGILNEFTQDSLRIADAVSQGAMKSTEAKSRMRSLFSKYAATAPGLTDDLLARQKAITTQSGLGKVIAEGTAQEQAMVKVEQEAITEGWVDGTANEATRAEQLQLYREYQRSQEELAAASAQLSFQSQQVGLETSQLNLQKQKSQQKAQKALASLASAYTPKFQMDMVQLTERVRKGEIEAEDAIQQAELSWNNIQATVAAIGNEAGSEHISNLSAPMRSMFDNTVKHLKGETSLEVLKNQNDKSIALASKEFLSDPKRTRIVATSRLINNNLSLDHMIQLDGSITDFVGGMSKEGASPANVVTSDPEEVQTMDGWMGILNDNMDAALKGDLEEDSAGELTTNLVNMFRSVNVHGVYQDEPKQYQRLVDFLADPKFGKYSETVGGIPADIATDAANILERQYSQKVIPMLREEYEEAILRMDTGTRQLGGITGGFGTPRPAGTGSVGATDVIQPVWTGTGVTFKGTSPNSRMDRSLQVTLNTLNKRVAPQLNKMIRLSAHTAGNRDYKAVYEQTYKGIFGAQPEGQEPTQAAAPAPPAAPRPPPRGRGGAGYELVDPSNPRSPDSWRRVNE